MSSGTNHNWRLVIWTMLAEMQDGNLSAWVFISIVSDLMHDKSNFAKKSSSSGNLKDISTYFCGNFRPSHGLIDSAVCALSIKLIDWMFHWCSKCKVVVNPKGVGIHPTWMRLGNGLGVVISDGQKVLPFPTRWALFGGFWQILTRHTLWPFRRLRVCPQERLCWIRNLVLDRGRETVWLQRTQFLKLDITPVDEMVRESDIEVFIRLT